MKKGHIHIGTSGWSYKHWKGIYYPENLKQKDWLPFHMRSFDVTELNTSFYHLPAITTTKEWGKISSAGFKFCPKMSRYLTHMKKLNDPEESLERFFEVFAPLKKKLGPVLVQLPRMVKFNFKKAENLYKIFAHTYKYYRFVMEVRHDSWLAPESIDLMKKYKIGLVISQSGIGFPYSEMVTANDIYIRFHGPGALYASSYSDKELDHYAHIFKQWIKKGHELWVFFNNDIHGYAIGDAKRLQEIMKI